MPTRKLAKWQMLLSEFDIVYVTQKAIKAQAFAIHLAENPVDEEYEPLNTYFHDEEGKVVGAVLVSKTGQHYPMAAKLRFNCTNNMAEYEACILGLKMAIDMNVYELLVIGDSDLLIHKVQGEWAVNNPKIIPYVQYVQNLCKRFRKIEFIYTPRIQNELADALPTITSMIKHPDTDYIDPLDIDLQENLVHCSHVESEPDGLPWYFDIMRYLESGAYPEDATSRQKKPIRRMDLNFFLHGKVLYRWTPYLGILRSVDAAEAVTLIEQIDAGFCGTHMNGLTLARKVLRAGYFWITMENECCKLVQKCHKCQVHGDLIWVAPHELYAMSSPWQFVSWGMDVIASYKSVTKKVVADFVRNNLICRFGFPESIITDNGANLNSHLMKEICEEFKIIHQRSIAYRPQMNGARGWHEMLPYALLGYRTMVRTSTGATPYLLVYGTEEVVPVEVEILSLRIIQEAKLSNAEWVSKRIDELDLIDEKRMVTSIFPHRDEYKGKFAPNWKGPYMVRKVQYGGALVLSEMDGTIWRKPINSDAVKRYYA
nr:uncharacterized protein LOC109119590 [Solanum lycopersicum]